MSKASTTANKYEGDGEWFKIHQRRVSATKTRTLPKRTGTYGKDRIEFTIPSNLPDGEYMIRPEHIENTDRIFSCAQVKVVGGGNGTPGPTVKFPGAYKKDDPSFNFSIWNGYKEYPMSGPKVWSGESVGL